MKTPQQLGDFTFTKALKGYNTAEVDEQVKYLLSNYSDLYNAYLELDAKYKTLNTQFLGLKTQEDALSSTIVNAQKIADNLVNDATVRANVINSSIKDSFDEIIEEYKTKTVKAQEDLLKVQKNAIDFKNALLAGYRQHVELIDGLIPYADFSEIEGKTQEELVEAAVERAAEKVKESGIDISSAAPENNQAQTESDSQN